MIAAKALAFSTLRGACRVLPGSVYSRLHARGIDQMYRALRGDQDYSIRHAGGRLWLPATDSSLNRALLLRGSYEPEAVAAFRAVLEPGMTVFDLGANIGYYTTVAATSVGPTGRVYAFEPDPRNVEVLRRNSAQVRGAPITVVAAAVGEGEGTSSLFVNPTDSSINSLARANADVLGPGNAASPLTVPSLTLDTFVRQQGAGQPDVIKIDVQGAEMLVLSGAHDVLSHRPLKIFFEFWPFGLQQLGTPPVEFLEFLIGKGFSLRLLGGEQVRLTTPAAAASFARRWNAEIEHARTWHANFLASN